MKIYEAEYRVDQGQNQLHNYFRGQFEVVTNKNGSDSYTRSYSGLITREFYIIDDGEKIIEVLHTHIIYHLSCLSLIFLTIERYIKNTIFSGLIGSVFLSVFSILLFLLPFLILNHKPKFFNPGEELAKSLPQIIYPSRVRLNTSVFVPILAGLFILNTLPLISSNTNILTIVLVSPAILVFGLSLEQRKDPATAQIFLFSTMVLTPFSLTSANIYIFSQKHFLINSSIIFGVFGINPSLMFLSLSIYIMVLVILLNVAVLYCFLTVVFPKLCRLVAKQAIFQYPQKYTNENIVSRGTFFIVGSIHIFIPAGILSSFLIGNPLINIQITNLIFCFIPVFITVSIWMYYWANMYFYPRLNQYGFDIENMSEIHILDDDIDILLADIGESAAVPLPRWRGKPSIVINTDLANVLAQSEIEAILYHELYHIKEKTLLYQDIINIPLIGYLLFFLINPVTVYKEEFNADEYAASVVGKKNVVSALEKTENELSQQNQQPIYRKLNKQKNYLAVMDILWNVPLLSFYRPPRKDRISNLKKRMNQE
jgi:Zn-dependent protease with chaperone function